MQKLIEYLNSLQPGKIQVNEELKRLVSVCWPAWLELEESDEIKVEGYSNLHWIEKAFWDPPNFSFTIRENMSRRMICKMDPRLNVAPKEKPLTG